ALTSSGVILGSGSGSFTPLYVKLRSNTLASIMASFFLLLLSSWKLLPCFAAALRKDWALPHCRLDSAVQVRHAWKAGRISAPAAAFSLSDERLSLPRPFLPLPPQVCCATLRASAHSWRNGSRVPHPTPQRSR